jgi:very-long-chain enoyl-CoA reductase
VFCLFNFHWHLKIFLLHPQFAQLSNLYTHITLRGLRPEGTRKRAIPHGYGFSLVSCPNYLFEIQGWIVISILTGSWSGEFSFIKYPKDADMNFVLAWLFTAVSTVQMTLWALKKHKAYKKEFGKDYPRGRKALIPFVL